MKNKQNAYSHKKPNNEAREVSVSAQRQAFSGPLPPPEILKQYQQLSPDLVNRIITLAEDEAQARRKLESDTLQANIEISKKTSSERAKGQIFGFSIGIVGLLSSVALASLGATVAASIVGSSTWF